MKPNYTIVEELISEKIETILPDLLNEHWEEVALNKQLMVLKPDVEKYKILDKMGMLMALCAYVGDTIVGYSVSIITPHLHYSDLLICQNDVIFVSKEYRNTPLGIRLIKKTEECAREKGVHMMLWHAKENSQFSTILYKKGYGVQDIIYSKKL